jgi:hypothetical protein
VAAPSSRDPFDGEIDFSSGFRCAFSALQLNGNRPFPRLVSNGVVPNNGATCTLELTSEKAEPRAVSAFAPVNFLSAAVNSVENLFWFESRFTYQIAGRAAAGGDGIAAVFHQDPRVQFAVGGDGGNMGVYGSSSIIIRNALVVEIDTGKYKNSKHRAKATAKRPVVTSFSPFSPLTIVIVRQQSQERNRPNSERHGAQCHSCYLCQ